jgi:hypothetical protein
LDSDARVYPYDPRAHIQTKPERLKALGGLPLLLAPSSELTAQSPIAGAVELLPIPVSSATKPSRCKECGNTLKKRVKKCALNTAAGTLLTGDEARRQMKENDARKKSEEEEKERKRVERAQKKVEKERGSGEGHQAERTEEEGGRGKLFRRQGKRECECECGSVTHVGLPLVMLPEFVRWGAVRLMLCCRQSQVVYNNDVRGHQ